MSSLAEAFPKEQARLRELLKAYHEIGPPGMIGAALIEATLREADEAVASQDVVRMVAVFKKMQETE